MVFLMLLLGILCGESLAIHFRPIDGSLACVHNDIWVECVPSCPATCSMYYSIQKCRPAKCQPGCACRKNWLRNNHNLGFCIPRSSCKRWILE